MKIIIIVITALFRGEIIKDQFHSRDSILKMNKLVNKIIFINRLYISVID